MPTPTARKRPPETLTAGEFLTMVALLAAALAATVMFVAWADRMRRPPLLAPPSEHDDRAGAADN